MTKKINLNLTAEQKLILFEEGTERAGSSELNHGHIFDDGPKPTGKRFCNNGICLVFKSKNKL